MNKLEIFNHPDFGQIRTVSVDGEPWFTGKDVAEALGYVNTKDALNTHVDEEDRRIFQRSEITTLENHLPKEVFPVEFVSADIPNRGMTFINESGVYALVFGSKLPSAKKFKHWVTSEVLPAIRKTGGYRIPTDPMSALKLMFEVQKTDNQRINELEWKVSNIAENAPLTTGEYGYVSNHIRLKVREVLTDFPKLNNKQVGVMYAAINREVNRIAGVRTRTGIRHKEFDNVCRFIESWYPSAATRELINQAREYE